MCIPTPRGVNLGVHGGSNTLGAGYATSSSTSIGGGAVRTSAQISLCGRSLGIHWHLHIPQHSCKRCIVSEQTSMYEHSQSAPLAVLRTTTLPLAHPHRVLHAALSHRPSATRCSLHSTNRCNILICFAEIQALANSSFLFRAA